MRYSIGIDMHQRYSFCSVKDTVWGTRIRVRDPVTVSFTEQKL